MPGASVARIARAHGVNANQVFSWRKLYQQGALGVEPNAAALVPVRIAEADTHSESKPDARPVCPDCGGKLRALGEDVSELLEYVPGHFEVIRLVRPKLSCTKCERIVEEPAPSRPIDRGLAGPGLLAHVLVSKFADHLPLYRQGLELDRSTLAGWVGGASSTLAPLVEKLRQYVMSAGKLHADDTPVPVLAPGHGQTKTGRLWTDVRDDRPAGDKAAPAVWFGYGRLEIDNNAAERALRAVALGEITCSQVLMRAVSGPRRCTA